MAVMKNMLIKLAVLTAAVMAAVSCAPRKTHRQAFEENYEANVRAVMTPFIDKGMDSLRARNTAECLVNELFRMDSTFFDAERKNMDNLNELVERHKEELYRRCMCGTEDYEGTDGTDTVP